MSKQPLSAFFALALGFATVAIQPTTPPRDHGVTIHNGFLRGTDYQSLPGERRRAYVMGVIDGMLLAPFFGGDRSEAKWLENCVEGMNEGQLESVVKKYLDENPAMWHHFAHGLIFSALQQECAGQRHPS